MDPIKAAGKFPEGAMERNGLPKPIPRDWVAKGVVSEPARIPLPDGIPPGSTLVITEKIPDTFAHVSPFLGTGHVLGFEVEYVITIEPPAQGDPP